MKAANLPAFAIVVSHALLFAFYSFRLSGLPGLLPIAYWGMSSWRTGSVYAACWEVRFGNNSAIGFPENILFRHPLSQSISCGLRSRRPRWCVCPS